MNNNILYRVGSGIGFQIPEQPGKDYLLKVKTENGRVIVTLPEISLPFEYLPDFKRYLAKAQQEAKYQADCLKEGRKP